MKNHSLLRRALPLAAVLLLLGAAASAQQQSPPKDALGRDTPRGTVLGFMDAARKGANDLAASYLNTDLHGAAATELVNKLFVVLDTRLPARLEEMSNRPEGSLVNPLKPDRDVVGTIMTDGGPLALVLQRVNRGKSGSVWLFSRETLDAIPDVYDEVHLVSVDRYLPRLLKLRFAGIRVFEWLALFLGIPVCYRLLGFIGRLLGKPLIDLRRRFGVPAEHFNLLPGPIRLLLLTAITRWLVSSLDLPLFERQFWAVGSALLITAAVAWLLLLLNGFGERYVRRQLKSTSFGEAIPLLRFVRRIADVVAIAICGLGLLRYLGINATAALAGLGIGGIAIALAAQKTLENVIGGVSIIFDQAVRVGDTVKIGDTIGTVDSIGLRSTRIRTPDRTMLSFPNGQIANLSVETLSERDKFWFHHIVGLRYDTTSAQLRSVVDGVHNMLARSTGVEPESVQVRFIRLGASSLDIEVVAYVLSRDWASFLEVQQELLLRIIETVEHAGTEIAIPSQTLQISEPRVAASLPGSVPAALAARSMTNPV